MSRSVSAIVVGAGFGGVAAAINLKRNGVEDLVVLERGDRIGGTWRANTYPGLACDVPSHLYSYSFAPNPDWSHRYSQGAEIRDYLEATAHRFGIDRHIRFGAEVQRAEWDDDAGRWRVTLTGGEELEAEVFVTAVGQLNRPSIPDIQGLETFRGPLFHSAHWDHGVELAGKRVAVLGTGASAIQFVPAIADRVAHLEVFQRTAPWVIPKGDREYPDRVRERHRRHPLLMAAWRTGWRLWMESLVPLFTRRPRRWARAYTAPYRWLANVQRFVELRGNPRLMRATKPAFAIGGKRILVTSDWYPTLRRPDVTLVTDRVKGVTEEGVVTADGTLHPADVIVLGTGFTATDFLAPMEITGRDGLALTEAWRDGAEAYYGISVPRFPNMFLLYGPNTNHGTGSMIEMLEFQARYVGEAAGLLVSGAAERLEVRQDVHDAFQAEIQERLRDTVWATTESWYVTASGRITNNWPGSQAEYRRRTAQVRLDDYLVTAPALVQTATGG